MSIKRVILSIYLKDDKVVRINVGSSFFLFLFLITISVFTLISIPYIDVKFAAKDHINRTNVLKVNEANESFAGGGYRIEKMKVTSENKLNFFLTKTKGSTKAPKSGVLSVNVLDSNNNILTSLDSESFSFVNGRFTTLSLNKFSSDLIKKIEIRIKDVFGNSYKEIMPFEN